MDDGAFALPANAATPTNTFEGTLTLSGNATGGGFATIRDDYSYTGTADSPRKHLPNFSFQFVQNGSHFIPVNQGLYITGNTYWNYIIGPGRVWNESSDNGYSRVAFPFALIQRNSNCTQNGVMTFLFNATTVSKVRYQVTQETCVYFKFNMWGQLSATYTPRAVTNATIIKNNHAAEVTNRLPTKPMSAIATDYPGSGFDEANLTTGITAAHLTWYGLLINGVNYISGCNTRYGVYAFCESMRVPSYSTAKSAFNSVSLMRLGQKYGTGVYNLLIKNYIPEYTNGDAWTAVTFNNTLDMATGNYTFASHEVDEAGTAMITFFTSETYTAKINHAFSMFKNKKSPGQMWVYHSSDSFILNRAMSNYLVAQGGGSDIFDMVRDEVYTPINLSAGAKTTERTDNSVTGKPFGGYGLFWTQDDIAKIAKLLNNDNDNGMAGGVQLLQPFMLADSMQKNAADRGMDTTGSPVLKYNNGFWARQFTSADGYTCSFYTPFMSGYGGITVEMMPNGATYYYFSDNEEFAWTNAVSESNKLIPQCP